MVFPAAAAIASFVARATPAAFVAIDATCKLLEDAGGESPVINALRQACEVRKALKRKRRRKN